MQTQNYPKQQPEKGKFITFNGILLEFLLLKKEIKWPWDMAFQIWIEMPCDEPTSKGFQCDFVGFVG